MIIKEYRHFKPTEEDLAYYNHEFTNVPVRDWDTKLLLAFPYGDTLQHAKKAVPDMCYYAKRGATIATCPSPFIDIQRNEFGLAMLQDDYDYLIMLDVDQANGENILERFALIAYLCPDVEVAVANVATRSYPHYPAWYYLTDTDDLVVPTEWDEDKGLIRVGMGGTGAMMIKKETLQKLPYPWFQYDYSEAGRGEYIREDTYFNNLCRKHGVKVWVDPNIKVGHYTRSETVTVDKFLEEKERYGEDALFDNRKR